MRALWLVAALLIPAGCLDDSADAPASQVQGQAPDVATQDVQADPPAAVTGQRSLRQSIEGRYEAVKPLGERLREQGGVNPLDVSGWSAVRVTLDSSIEVDLVLLPPGCAATTDPCALRFSPPEDEAYGRWELPAMDAGSWTAVVEADADDYSYVNGVYAIHFEYHAA